jgi:hypothetical protein
VTIGTNQYTFVSTLVNTVAGQVKWATTFNASMSNLIAAIDDGSGAGTKYSTGTKANPFVTAGPLVNQAFVVTAISTNAAIGDMVATLFTPATPSVNLTWSGNDMLINGANYMQDFTAFINHSLVADQGTTLWTTYFENDGTISNGTGSFTLDCGLGVLTNGNLRAQGDVVLIATNTGNGFNTLIFSNTMIQVGRKFTLWSTNITDTGVTNGNIWVVGTDSGGGSFDSGFNTLVGPPAGSFGSFNPEDESLLGTTVTNIAPFDKEIYNVWAGNDYGINPQGYTNNLAVGHLVFDVQTTNSKVAMVFSGASVGKNALYIDLLELKDGATAENNSNPTNHYNFSWLQINTNMVVYYAQALDGGNSVAEAIDNASRHGGNSGGRLRWVYSYAGYYSSTNLVYTNQYGMVITNTVNTALVQSPDIDSDSDGIPNDIDPTRFFVPSEINLTTTTTNLPPKVAKIEWTTIPNATNFIFYTTNLTATNGWLAFTNFKASYYGNNVTNSHPRFTNGFISPQAYINNASLPDNSQQTNVWIYDVLTNVPHYYKVVVWPWLNFPE